MNALPQGTMLQGKSHQYKLIKKLGQGSFGITYLAMMKATIVGDLGPIEADVKVAIKEFFLRDFNGRNGTLVTSGSNDSIYHDYKKKFLREAKNLSKFKHPNIIKVLESFEANNTVYYVMEYIGGGSLDDLIGKGGCIAQDETVRIAKKIGDALSFMHQKRMLHLDLKPANIMMRESGEPVLIDFGLSKQYGENGEPESSTQVGGGTPGYAPMEQTSYQEGKDFPVTMNVYALGATLFKMLTGRRAPEASHIFNDGFPYDEFQKHDIGDKFVSCIAKAMAPAKKDRYQTVKSFISDIDESTAYVLDELPVGYVLRDKRRGEAYEITAVVDKAPSCIHYTAVRDNAPRARKEVINVYEFFDGNVHERILDRTLNVTGDPSEKEAPFIALCEEKTKGAVAGRFSVDKGNGWQTFQANNTWYLITYPPKKERKPFPWDKVKAKAKSAGIVLASMLVAVGAFYLIYLGWNAFSDYLDRRAEAQEKEMARLSRSLTNAIEQNNTNLLQYFAELDSTRAFAPYAKALLEQGEMDKAKEYAQKAGNDPLAATVMDEIKQREQQIAEVKEEVEEMPEEEEMVEAADQPKPEVEVEEPKPKEEPLPPVKDDSETKYKSYLSQAQQAFNKGQYQAARKSLNNIKALGNAYYDRTAVTTLAGKVDEAIKKQNEEKIEQQNRSNFENAKKAWYQYNNAKELTKEQRKQCLNDANIYLQNIKGEYANRKEVVDLKRDVSNSLDIIKKLK